MEDRKVMVKAYRYFKFGIIICILGILISPFLPWLSVTSEEYEEDSDDEKTVTRYLSENTIRMYADYVRGDLGDVYEDLSNNIGLVTTFLWLTLIFLMLGYLGVVFYYVSRKFEIPGKILVLIGCFALIFAILCAIFNGLCFVSVMELQDAYEDDYGGSNDEPQFFLGYNYVPLIASILLIFIGILLVYRVFLPTLRSVRSQIYFYQSHHYQVGPYGSVLPAQPPPPFQAGEVNCINCGGALSAGMAYCPSCGTSTGHSVSPPPPDHREPAQKMTVYKCPRCRAIIMDPSKCPYCGWSNVRH
jgi:hypothetical protein